MVNQLWYLKNCDVFRSLGPAQLARLESRSKYRKFGAKELVYLPNDQGDSVLLLADGRVKMYYVTSEGKQSVLAFIDPGELFGELAILEPADREEFAEATEPSNVIMISGAEIQRLMAEQPTVSLEMTRLIGLRRRRIERRLKSLLYRSPRERMVCLLLELAEKYGERCADGLLLNVRLSHQEMSNVIGTTREMVTVMLGELRSQRMIEIKRRRIIVKQVARLADSVGETVPRLSRGIRPVPARLQRAGLES
ncbi:MAG: Crp/Fnr family transcriptional regulator [Planctomycetaceae bacterium]